MSSLREPTTKIGHSTTSQTQPVVQHALCLSIVWSREEPELVGSFIEIPPPSKETAYLIRRVDHGITPEKECLPLSIETATGIERHGYFRTDFISRRALVIRPMKDYALMVESHGKNRVLVNGKHIRATRVEPGSIIELEGQVLFLVVKRDIAPLGLSHFTNAGAHTLGFPDQDGIVGESRACWELRKKIVTTSLSKLSVLILGKQGTGKEAVARALYRLACRNGKSIPFVAYSCGQMVSNFSQMIFFGHTKGYPNGLNNPARIGLVEQANGGVLFLDEFGDIPEDGQVALLRVLEEGTYSPLGAEGITRHTKFLLIGATDQPKEKLRPALLGRFHESFIQVPTLEQRLEDIPLMIQHIARSQASQNPAYQRFIVVREQRSYVRVHASLVAHCIQNIPDSNVRGIQGLVARCMAESLGDTVRLSPGTSNSGRSVHSLAKSVAPAPAVVLPVESQDTLGFGTTQPRSHPTLNRETPGEYDMTTQDPMITLDEEEEQLLSAARQCQFGLKEMSRLMAKNPSISTLSERIQCLAAKVLCKTSLSENHAVLFLSGGRDPELMKGASAALERTLRAARKRLERPETASELETLLRRHGKTRGGWLVKLQQALAAERG